MNSYNSSYNKGSYSDSYNSAPELVAYSTDSERAVFYRKTYTHVALALLALCWPTNGRTLLAALPNT